MSEQSVKSCLDHLQITSPFFFASKGKGYAVVIGEGNTGKALSASTILLPTMATDASQATTFNVSVFEDELPARHLVLTPIPQMSGAASAIAKAIKSLVSKQSLVLVLLPFSLHQLFS